MNLQSKTWHQGGCWRIVLSQVPTLSQCSACSLSTPAPFMFFASFLFYHKVHNTFVLCFQLFLIWSLCIGVLVIRILARVIEAERRCTFFIYFSLKKNQKEYLKNDDAHTKTIFHLKATKDNPSSEYTHQWKTIRMEFNQLEYLFYL